MAEAIRSDADLVRATLAGEREAFDALIQRHFGLVHVIGLARLGEADRAEDLAQEVFLRAYIHLAQLDPPERFPAWLSRIARNLAIDWLRRGQCGSRLLPMVPLDALAGDVADPEAKGVRETMAETEENQAVHRALKALPPEQREIVLLRFTEGLSQSEIGERLGLHQTTVGKVLRRALRHMKAQIEPMLREAAPALRPTAKAAVRAIAVIATFEAMAPAAKAALLTAASAGATSGGGLAQASGSVASLGLLATLSGWLAGGTQIMATARGVTAAVAAVAIIGGGFYLNQRGDVSPSPAPSATEGMAVPSVAQGIPARSGVFAVTLEGAVSEMLPVQNRPLWQLMNQMQASGDPRGVLDRTDLISIPRTARLFVRSGSTELRIQQISLDEMIRLGSSFDRRVPGSRQPFVHDVAHEWRAASGQPEVMELVLTEPLTGDLLILVSQTREGEVLRLMRLTGEPAAISHP